MESILYQGKHNPFANGLINIFNEAIESISKNDFNGARNTLDSVAPTVKQFTGISADVIVTEVTKLTKVVGSPYTVSVIGQNDYAQTNLLNPSATEALREGNLSTFRPESLLNGKMDFKTGKVSGFYSDIKFTFDFSEPTLDGSLTGEELASILLHELGHAWSLLATMGVGTVTSAMVAGISDFYQRYEDPKKRLAYGKMVSQASGSKRDYSDEVELINAVVANCDSMYENITGLRFKSDTTGEYLADQFATRWGMGTSLAVALSKLYTVNSYVGKLRMGGRWKGILGTTARIVSSPLLAMFKPLANTNVPAIVFAPVVAGTTFLVVGTTFEVLFSMMITKITDTVYPNGQHPSLVKRVEAIRRDNIAMLQTKLSKVDKTAILSDLDVIDELYKDVRNWTNIYTDVVKNLENFITGKSRGTNYIESLADRTHNRLHELKARIEAIQ